MSFLQQSNLKLNAAGLTPDHSLTLPERAPQADEQEILQAIQEVGPSTLVPSNEEAIANSDTVQFYSSTASSSSLPLQIFSPQVVVTRSNGEVHVGIQGLQLRSRAIQGQAIRSTRLRLLATPEALAPRTMCIDLITCAQDANEGSRTLLVLKRNAKDGLITSVTEEEGHRRVSQSFCIDAAHR